MRRLLPPTQPNNAAYLALRNLTDADLRIVAAESPAAQVTELHDHGQGAARIMRMRGVDSVGDIGRESLSSLREALQAIGGLSEFLSLQPVARADTLAAHRW